MENKDSDVYIEQLANKFRKGALTKEEQAYFDFWYSSFNDEEFVNLDADQPELAKARIYKGIFELMQENQSRPVRKSLFRWSQIAVAATVFLITGLALYFFKFGGSDQRINSNRYNTTYIEPGKNAATLTLVNGKKILLSDQLKGEFAKEAGVVITKSADGQIIYQIKSGENILENQINTLSTDRGQQYQIILADGTKIWLNAASSLKYPVTFSKGQRKVELIGEAYLEVAKDKDHPFIVQSGKQMITVLGTHFNVNAYPEEAEILTTLLEGSVKLNGSVFLKPGQQAMYDGNSIKVETSDTEHAIAWIQGNFVFDEENLASIMRKISRWYNVEVQFESENLKEMTFSGSISRTVSIKTMLHRLSLTKEVNFKIAGQKIIVQPYILR
jgi:transmembrane sensor